MKTRLKSIGSPFVILLVIFYLQSCVPVSPPPAALPTTPTFTCSINGAPTFTATSITGSLLYGGEIIATNSSPSGVQQIIIQLSSISSGSYSLMNGYQVKGFNCGSYFTGNNINAMTQYNTSDTVPYRGTCTVNTNTNNVISGNFSFTAFNPVAGIKTCTVTGSFVNIPMSSQPVSVPSTTPTFTCLVNSNTLCFPSANIIGSLNYGGEIIATSSSPSATQRIIIQLDSVALGTYSLMNGFKTKGFNCGVYFSGPNINTLTQYNTTAAAPYTGTCIIYTNANNVISGTFSFSAVDSTGTLPHPIITHGYFTNINM